MGKQDVVGGRDTLLTGFFALTGFGGILNGINPNNVKSKKVA